MVTPYFLSKPSTEAMTTLAQSVSGMKPILTSFFSGASEPWACTSARSAGLMPTAPTAAACSNWRRGRPVAGAAAAVVTAAVEEVVVVGSSVMACPLRCVKTWGKKKRPHAVR